jgi:small subunit ribosomal protein S20
VANTKSAKKAIKVQERRRARNQMVKTRVRTSFKKANQAVAAGDSEKAQSEVTSAISQLDKAVAKGIIHKNTAARKKSRLMKKLNASG